MIEEFAGPSVTPDHRRLATCVAISALVLAAGIAMIDVPLRFDFARWIPLVLDVTLRDAPEPRVAEPPDAPPVAETAQPPATAEPRPSSAAPAAVPPAAVSPAPAEQPVDWYQALERAAADVVDRHAVPDSLHPEFDELRRIAREHYAEPQTGKPPPTWENVEEDIYGRTLLRRGNCFQVLDDRNVGNRYAFETFERHLTQCGISLGRAPPKNLPWVAIIRARYPYLRDPDGSQSAAAGASSQTGD